MEISRKRTRAAARPRAAVFLKSALPHAAAVGCGFLLANVGVGSSLSPFAAAFTAAAPGGLTVSAAVGASLGALVFFEALPSLKYIGAVVLVLLFRAASRSLEREERALFLRPAAAFLGLLLSASAVMLTQTPQLETALLAVCEATIALASAAFWQRTFTLLPEGEAVLAAEPADLSALLFCGALLLRAGTAYEIAGVSPARMLGFFLLLAAAFGAGVPAGALAGICAGLTLGFAPAEGHLMYALPAAGVLCGLTRGAGRFAASLGFLLCDLLFLLLKGEAGAAFPSVLEAGAAACVFLVLPAGLMDPLLGRLRPAAAGRETEQKLLLRIRAGRLAGAAKEMYEAVAAVCRLVSKERAPQPEEIRSAARQTVCEACPKRVYCWERARPLTDRAFAAAGDAVLKNGRLYPETLPERLAVSCRAADALCDAFNAQYAAYAARLSVRADVYELKETAAAQFRSVSGLLLSAADEVCAARTCEPYVKRLIGNALEASGVPAGTLAVWTDPQGRCSAELVCETPPRSADWGAALARIREKTGIRFAQPVCGGATPEGSVLCFFERPPLRVEFHKYSVPAAENAPCGDACEGFADAAGGFCCVLSDGMGTGAEAAVNAGMTASLLAKLLRAGLGEEAAIRAVNAALLVNASEELLATVDICRVDLYTGKTLFLKAGGAASVVKRGAKTLIVERASLPLGILRETKYEHSELVLSPGDAVVMMSDGADCVPPQFFKKELLQNGAPDAKTLCERILKEAGRRAPIGRRDDATAACLRILPDDGT